MDLHLVLILLTILEASGVVASALSHHFHKMSTSFVQKYRFFSHLKVLPFGSIMSLFVSAWHGNERLSKSSPSLSLSYFFSSEWLLCLILPGFTPQKHPSLKDFLLIFSLDFYKYQTLDFNRSQSLKGSQILLVNCCETWELFVAMNLFSKTNRTHWPQIHMEVLEASMNLPWNMISRCLALASSPLGSARSTDVSMEAALV